MNYTKISRELLNKIQFRVMDESDKMGFNGVESPLPLIGEIESEGIIVIIDGEIAELYCVDGCANFDLVDTCQNIRQLPYKTQRELKIEAEIAKMEKAIAELRNELCY